MTDHKWWVFDVSGSRVETERGVETEVFAVHFDGHRGPHSVEMDRVTMLLGLEQAAILVAGLRVMAAEAGKRDELDRIVDSIEVFDDR